MAIDLETLKRGDHLRAPRAEGLYHHHGVYIGNGLVIDFGGGGITAKGQAAVREVTLNEFEDGATAQVVHHPQNFLFGFGMGLPEALPPDEIVARAGYLQGCQTASRYNLVASNCEHLANWAVTGGYFESLQVRRLFYAKAVADMVLFYAWTRDRQRWSPVMRVLPVGIVIVPLYQWLPYRTWRDILKGWPGYPGPEESGELGS